MKLVMGFPLLRNTHVVPSCSSHVDDVNMFMHVVFSSRCRWECKITSSLSNLCSCLMFRFKFTIHNNADFCSVSFYFAKYLAILINEFFFTMDEPLSLIRAVIFCTELQR